MGQGVVEQAGAWEQTGEQAGGHIAGRGYLSREMSRQGAQSRRRSKQSSRQWVVEQVGGRR